MDKPANKSKLALIASMILFGTIGIFRRYIPLPSSVLALARGLIGTLFLVLLLLMKGSKPSLEAIQKNLWLLLASGALIGFNWILLFEAYQYTSVATATLCYYMAPVIVIFVSPFLLKESLTAKKIICAVVALLGMVLVSGVLRVGFAGLQELKGVFFGLGAAVLYASVIVLNQKIKNISAYDKTLIQLAVAAIVLMPYSLLTENWSEISFTPTGVILLIVVGVVHTGMAYALYFGSMNGLKAQTVALLSYIDPIVAVLLSALLLREDMGILEIIGTVLVLGAAMVSELPKKKKNLYSSSL